MCLTMWHVLNRMQNVIMQGPSLGTKKNGPFVGGAKNSRFKAIQYKGEYNKMLSNVVEMTKLMRDQ